MKESPSTLTGPAGSGPGGLRAGPRVRVLLLTVLAAAALFGGCGREEDPTPSLQEFGRLTRRVEALYLRIHPLRSSRLGVTRADSLLFTFGPEETGEAAASLDSLLTQMTSLPARHFGPRDLDRSRVMIDWLRGEIFALTKLQLHRSNPLLYTWMVEEAFYSMVSRTFPPYPGEAEAYEKRLSLVPLLLDNAEVLVENPAGMTIGPASRMLTDLLDDSAGIRSAASARYGRVPRTLDRALDAVEKFNTHIVEDFGEGARGRFILGTEALSDILDYSEGLDLDLEEAAAEAESTLRKYVAQVRSIDKNPHMSEARARTGGPETLESIIDSIGRLASGSRSFKGSEYEAAAVVRQSTPPLQEILPSNPFLLIPARTGGVIRLIPPMLEVPEHRGPTVVAAPGAERMPETELWYEAMAVSAPVTGVKGIFRPDGGDAESLLRSELFDLEWRALNVEDLVPLEESMRLRLKRLHLKRKIDDLSMMVAAFRLHTGIFDLDSATAFLAGSMGIPSDVARERVVLAASSPSVAFPGIARLLVDRMVKTASTVRGERRPRDRVRDKMIENAGRPPGLIMERIDR